jgi:iron-sulfur cluster assembly protein
MMKPNITFTEAAALHIKKMIEKEQGLGFRLSIKKTGCSGYTYLPAIVKEKNAADIILDIADEMKVFVDSTWIHLLENVQIDYAEENNANFKQKKLIFTNNKEKARCGCGESFHVESGE